MAAPAPPVTDWSSIPLAYSLLLNEKLIYPADLSQWRMRIDSARQLFVDNWLIARVEGIKKNFHAVRKHPANPVVTDISRPYVCSDPEGGYRLYGQSYSGKFHGSEMLSRNERGSARRICIAFSADGIHWRTPAEQPVVSRMDPSQAWSPMFGGIQGLFYEPQDPDAEQRWKIILRDFSWLNRFPKSPVNPEPASYGYSLFVSPDGIHWTFKNDTCLTGGSNDFRSIGSPASSPPTGVGDTLRVRWDPILRTYIGHTKHTIGPDWRFPFGRWDAQERAVSFYEARVAGWTESEDLIHWTSPRIYACPDNEDAKFSGMYGIYEADGFPYESMWLGCFSMSANVPGDCGASPRRPIGYKRNWIRLAGSRDGRTWYYLGNRDIFIPNGPTGQWDAHYLRLGEFAPGGPMVREDELWFYYSGAFGGVPECPGLSLPRSKWKSAMGIGVLRRDGFVSLDAGAKPGRVITRPLVFEGRGELFVNANVAEGGYLGVSILDEAGNSLKGFEEDACDVVKSDNLRGRIAWKGGKSLVDLKGRYVRLVFHLRNAQCYSFWIE